MTIVGTIVNQSTSVGGIPVTLPDPEEELVPAQVRPPAVQEHRCHERRPERQRDRRREVASGRVLARDETASAALSALGSSSDARAIAPTPVVVWVRNERRETSRRRAS